MSYVRESPKVNGLDWTSGIRENPQVNGPDWTSGAPSIEAVLQEQLSCYEFTKRFS
jgi:hypothetical protein